MPPPALCPALLSKERSVAPPNYNRWLTPTAAVAVHLCIGSVYSWSIFNPVLVKELGVAASAADDWSLGSVVWIFSIAILVLGGAATVVGRWSTDLGPRCIGVAAACFWGGGLAVAAAGIYLHQLWLLYLGYGVLGGCGLGMGYIMPVPTLISWFPHRRGMATGLAIMGFGGGAMIGAPLQEFLIRTFYQAPQYLGAADAVPLVTQGGRRFAEVSGRMVEVVAANAADAANMIVPGLEGVYVVGSGATGAAQTFLVLGAGYFLVMLAASFIIRTPAPGWAPDADQPGASTEARGPRRTPAPDVHVNQAVKTPQFYLLWLLLCLNVTAGIGVLGVASTMMTDIFGSSLPGVVTPAFAGFYVLMISAFNMAGRFFWSSISDYIGRKLTYTCFFALGGLLYLSVPFTARMISVDAAIVWLVLFYVITMLIFTMYGGGFATIPAYITDVFGTMHVAAIHGRLLTAWSAAGVLGPLVLTSLRNAAIDRSIHDVARTVDPDTFSAKFGAPISQLNELIEARTVTIAQLMDIAPPGTTDPTTGLYDTTMFAMAALLAVAFAANLFVRPAGARRRAGAAPQAAEA